jgi:fibronectin-binding autotransporter adhesin
MPLVGGGVFVDVGGLNFLDNVVVTGNTASSGGGIYISPSGGPTAANLSLIRTTISNNDAVDVNGEGGGIVNNGELTVNSSTIAGNQVTAATFGAGGGIWMAETGAAFTLVSNSTITGNSVRGSGGGLYLGNGILAIESSTIARNTSDSDDAGNDDGGGIYVVVTSAGGQGADLANTLLAQNGRGTANPVADQCGLGNPASSVESFGYNLRGSADAECNPAFVGTGDMVDANPLLGPLSSNGGQTLTMPLLPGSPALNAANPLTPNGAYPACEPFDQRGFPRGGAEGRCDIGAFEGVFQAPVQPPPGAGTPTGAPFNLKAAVKKCKKKFPKGPKRKKCIKRAQKRAQA